MVRDNKNENKFSFLKFYFVPIGIGTILLSQNHKTSADGIPYKNRFSPFWRESILVRVAIQNFLKNPVISMVFRHPNRKIILYIPPHSGDCFKAAALFYA